MTHLKAGRLKGELTWPPDLWKRSAQMSPGVHLRLRVTLPNVSQALLPPWVHTVH